MKKLILIVVILTFVSETYSQSINDLYSSLKLPLGLEKEITTDTSFYAFYNNNKRALITLTNGKRRVKLIIFDKLVTEDSTFKKEDFKNRMISSCRNYNTDDLRFVIASFSTIDFYIKPVLCPSCNFYDDKRCKRLAKAITKWTQQNIVNHPIPAIK